MRMLSEFLSLVNSLNFGAAAACMLNPEPWAGVNLGCGAATMCCWWETQKAEIFLQSSVNLDSTSGPFLSFLTFFLSFFFPAKGDDLSCHVSGQVKKCFNIIFQKSPNAFRKWGFKAL